MGAVQVYAGLTQVNKVGAGPFMGFTVTAALIASLAIDDFGWFRMEHHPINVWRSLGGLLLVGGVTAHSKVVRLPPASPSQVCVPDCQPLSISTERTGLPASANTAGNMLSMYVPANLNHATS